MTENKGRDFHMHLPKDGRWNKFLKGNVCLVKGWVFLNEEGVDTIQTHF